MQARRDELRTAMAVLFKDYLEEEFGFNEGEILFTGARYGQYVEPFSIREESKVLAVVNPFSFAVPFELLKWAFSVAEYVAAIESRDHYYSYEFLGNYFSADLNLAKLIKLAGGGLLSYDPIFYFVVAVARRDAPSEVEPRILTGVDAERVLQMLKALGADAYMVSSAAVKGYAIWDLDFIVRGRGCLEYAKKIKDAPPTDLICVDEGVIARNKWGRGWRKTHVRLMNEHERRVFS